MNSDPWKLGYIVVALLLIAIKLVSRWWRKKPGARLDRKSRDWLGLILSGFIIVVILGFGLLLVATFSRQGQTSPALAFATEALAAFAFFGMLGMVVVRPIYNHFKELQERVEQLEKLQERVDQLEKRQEQLIEQQIPRQRELDFMNKNYLSDERRSDEDAIGPS